MKTEFRNHIKKRDPHRNTQPLPLATRYSSLQGVADAALSYFVEIHHCYQVVQNIFIMLALSDSNCTASLENSKFKRSQGRT